MYNYVYNYVYTVYIATDPLAKIHCYAYYAVAVSYSLGLGNITILLSLCNFNVYYTACKHFHMSTISHDLCNIPAYCKTLII